MSHKCTSLLFHRDTSSMGPRTDFFSGHHLQGYEHKERLERNTQRQIFKELERQREWFIEKHHGAMSVVMMNIVKQLSINVKLQVQHLSRPDDIAYNKSLL